MKNNQQVFRVIVFLTIFFLISSYVSKVFSHKFPFNNFYDQVDGFYQQPQDSIDVLFLGASGFGSGISPLTIWEETGITSYNRAIPSQKASMMYYYLLESLKYQQPKVVVLDAYRLVREKSIKEEEISYRRSYEPLKLSPIKIRCLFDITSDSELDTFIGFVFPFYLYHTRWSELNRNDFEFYKEAGRGSLRGQYKKMRVHPIEIPDDFMAPTGEVANIRENERKYFRKMIRICKQNNIDVFFLVLPRLSTADYSEYVAVKEFADENQVMFIDYNFPELMSEVGFNPSTDVNDPGHVNICGAQKFSTHLSQVLSDNFKLRDHRKDQAYKQWDSDYKRLERIILNTCDQ